MFGYLAKTILSNVIMNTVEPYLGESLTYDLGEKIMDNVYTDEDKKYKNKFAKYNKNKNDDIKRIKLKKLK